MDTQITVLLVDDHPVFRKGLRLLLEEEQDMKVIGEAGDGKAAIDLARQLSPDVIVMDITMPDFNGIEATEQIVSESPDIKVMALSIHSGKHFVEDMLRAGAIGYVLKDSAPEELVQGIRTVKQGEVYLSAAITGVVVSEYKGLLSATGHTTETFAKSILRTKLNRPPVSADIIPRARLMELQEKGRHRSMTLIAAPAGYGKSVLASQWLAECDSPGAWLSLEEDNDDLHTFFSYFIAAVQSMFPTACQKTDTLLKAANVPPLTVFSASLINELDEINQPFILVLDDYHHIHDQAVHEVLSELLRNPPRHMHIIFTTRRDPPLPLVKLRAQEKVTEIRVQDLRFTEEETSSYLRHILEKPVEQSTATIWTEKTEGWVTGLRLAALSMRHREDIDTLTLEAPGGAQYITEYLFSEVLSLQPAQVRRFLLNTAILDRFCAPLIEAVCGPDVAPDEEKLDPWHFLSFLQKENMFIIQLDAESRWFRYHHLFQRLLQNQLQRHRSPEEIASLHSRASVWFAENSFTEEAMEHALKAGDAVCAAQIFERNRQSILNDDNWRFLEKCLQKLPLEVAQRRPELLLAQAWVSFYHLELEVIASVIENIERIAGKETLDTSTKGEINLFKAYLCYFQGQGQQCEQYLRSALEQIPDTYRQVRGEAELHHALALHMTGQKDSALKELNDLLRTGRSSEGIELTRLWAGISFIHLLDGGLPEALSSAQQLRGISSENNIAYVESWAFYLKAISHLFRGDLEDAEQRFSRVAANLYANNRRVAIDSLCALRLIHEIIQHRNKAEETRSLLSEFVAQTNDPILYTIASSVQARLSLLRGDDISFAVRWLRSADLTSDTGIMLWWIETPRITECRVLIAEGSDAGLQQALNKLQQYEQENKSVHNTFQRVGILSLMALAQKKQGRHDEALETLGQAIELAEPGGIIFPFVEIGPQIADLLKGLIRQNVATDFVGKVLAGFRQEAIGVTDTASTSAQPLVEPLTKREMEILTLLAERQRNKEIAEELFISPETVKRHTINIYQKLGVNDREQAVAKAKTLGILPSR